MSLSSPEIAATVRELQPLVGSQLQKIAAPTPRAVILEFRLPGRTLRLLISAEADETRLHLLLAPRPPSPRAPLPIQNLLRAHLSPARLLAMEAAEGDRIVSLRFETPGGTKLLVAELTGRHGNLFLLDDTERIIGAAIPSGSTSRPLHPGATYLRPPPPPQRKNAKGLRFDGEGDGEEFSLSRRIEEFYRPHVDERGLEERRREVLRTLSTAARRAATALRKIEGDAARAREAEGFRRYGDLLVPLSARIPRGARSVVATEYTEDGPRQVEVPLLPTLSGPENLERYFRHYRRLTNAKGRIEARLEELSQRRSLLEGLVQRAQEAATVDQLDSIRQEAGPALARRGERPSRKARQAPRPPFRSFLSASGRTIRVGRGAKENDALTFRFSRGNDLWLHARGVTGAHVVVPTSSGSGPDDETFLDACALAAHFSGARGEAAAEIACTEIKNVRRPKGSAPGAVLIVNERATAYRHDPVRIERLLASEA